MNTPFEYTQIFASPKDKIPAKEYNFDVVRSIGFGSDCGNITYQNCGES